MSLKVVISQEDVNVSIENAGNANNIRLAVFANQDQNMDGVLDGFGITVDRTELYRAIGFVMGDDTEPSTANPAILEVQSNQKTASLIEALTKDKQTST